ncbi:hypothetical protein OKW23_001428 [Bacilli bacterium PM5-9]|nr:hypothetical protein [Bacilli bacterium PM5-9]
MKLQQPALSKVLNPAELCSERCLKMIYQDSF